MCKILAVEKLRQAAAMLGENMHGDAGEKAGVAGKRTK